MQTRPSLRLLLPVLIVSAALRVTIALQGGQYFFGDEARYHRGTDLWFALTAHDWSAARAGLAEPEHAAFVWLGALLTPLQHALAQFTTHGDWTVPGNLYASAGLAAALLALFSAANLWLIYSLALRAGASAAGAGWALLLAAASNSLFYFSRHLLPYDVALTVWLAALVLGLAPTSRGALAGGLLAGLTYHFYNGYWFLPPAAFAWQCWWHWRTPGRNRLLGSWLAGGLAGGGLPLLIGTLAGGAAYWTTLSAFSGTVKQGLFAEGWSLPWAYLWQAEGWLGVAVLAAILFAAVRRPWPRAVGGWLGLLGLLYGALVLVSTGLHRFVLYGRTVHALVPLFCLAGGWALAELLQGRARALRLAAGGGVGFAAALMFAPHFGRLFPREIELQVIAGIGNPKRCLSFTGPIYRPLALPVTRPDLALANAQFLYPLRGWVDYPAGAVIFSLPHPLAYPPFQYEGHTPRERRLLREHPVAIRLIRLADPAAVPRDPPPASLFGEGDRPDGYDHHSPP
jgi:hypothetical protein